MSLLGSSLKVVHHGMKLSYIRRLMGINMHQQVWQDHLMMKKREGTLFQESNLSNTREKEWCLLSHLKSPRSSSLHQRIRSISPHTKNFNSQVDYLLSQDYKDHLQGLSSMHIFRLHTSSFNKQQFTKLPLRLDNRRCTRRPKELELMQPLSIRVSITSSMSSKRSLM